MSSIKITHKSKIKGKSFENLKFASQKRCFSLACDRKVEWQFLENSELILHQRVDVFINFIVISINITCIRSRD